MNDIAWCRATLDRLEERLTQFQQIASRNDRDLEDAKTIWHDSAAREVISRYLDPYQIDVKKVLGLLQKQLASLRITVQSMEKGVKPAHDIQRLSDEATKLRTRTDAEISTAHRSVDVSLNAAAACHEETQKGTGYISR